MQPQTCNNNPSQKVKQKTNGNVKSAKLPILQIVVTAQASTKNYLFGSLLSLAKLTSGFAYSLNSGFYMVLIAITDFNYP